jgi:uncharacterized protein (TIGR04255 family)
MMGRKYKKPPVVEALCEFQFVPSQSWDITIPGILYEKIRNEFPIKQQQMDLGVRVWPKEEGMPGHRVEFGPFGPPRMQFFRMDKISVVQIAQDLLTVNHLKPYPAWEEFKSLILSILGKYREIANPKGFKRINLGYINKIDLEEDKIEFTEYFNYYPSLPHNLPRTHKAFQVTVEIPYEQERDILRLTLATIVPEKPNTLSLVLDIAYAMVRPESIALDEVPDWLEDAHTIVENAFEACITEKCRALFEEVK